VRRGIDALTGALFLGALAIALPLGLSASRGKRELSVTVRANEPYEIAQNRAAPLAPAIAGPPELLPRLERAGEPDRSDPGLWLRTWQITYGRRWERQVTVPVLAGAFDPEGKAWPCAVAVRLGPRFFDDGAPGGEDLESVISRIVRAQFPFDVYGVHFAAVSNTSLSVRPVEGGLEVQGGIVLADGVKDPTQFAIKTKIALGEHGGDLAARIENVSVTWRGRTRHNPLVEMASMFIDVDEQARGVVAEKLRGALGIMKLPKEPLAIFADRPNDRFHLRLCDAPESHPSGVVVRLRIKGALAAPRVDAAIPGPPHVEARPEPSPVEGREAPPFEAAVSAAGVAQALYVLWQSGELAAWGKEPRVIESMRQKLGDRLAFDLGAIDLRLPPVVLPEGRPDAFLVRFGDLELGTSPRGERVVAHGDVAAVARVSEGGIGLAGTLADLRVNCVAGQRGAWKLSPCFSDVVPVLRDNGLTTEGLPLDLPIPDRLLRLNLVLNTDLVLRGLVGEVSGTPPMLRIKGEARLVKRAEPKR
jgi:hypothetical protein